MRNIKLTEEQYNFALSEGVTLKADVQSANGDVKKAVDNTKQQAIKNGVNLNNATIEIDGKDTNENYNYYSIGYLKRKALHEQKEKYSRLMSVKDFIKYINKK